MIRFLNPVHYAYSEGKLEIRLNLDIHCIETEIKRHHEAAILSYFKEAEDRSAAEAELVLLEKALAAFDFACLRGQWPVLSGGNSCPVSLTYDDIGRPCLCFETRCIIPPGKEE